MSPLTLSRTSCLGLITAAALLIADPAGAEPAADTLFTPVDLTRGRLAIFVDEEGTSRDGALVIFAREQGIVSPLPDPTQVSSSLRITSALADTAAAGAVFLDRSKWRRVGDGFAYRANRRRRDAPGGVRKIVFHPGRHGGTLMIWTRGDAYGANAIGGPVDYVQVAFGVGATQYVGRFQAPPATQQSNTADAVVFSGLEASVAPPPGHELIDVRGFPEIIVWGTQDLTSEEFDAIELPGGWIRNQPRSGVGSIGRFLRTPGRDADGEFTRQEMFGARWLHQASIVDLGGALDDQGLIQARLIDKHHELSWRAGSTIRLLTARNGNVFALVSRDDRRTTDTSPLPTGWFLEDVTLEEDLVVMLPQPTVNLRTTNEDSFQGPLPVDLPL